MALQQSEVVYRLFSAKLYRMSIDQIAAEALRLPPRERALLAESLWESLEDPFKAPARYG